MGAKVPGSMEISLIIVDALSTVNMSYLFGAALRRLKYSAR